MRLFHATLLAAPLAWSFLLIPAASAAPPATTLPPATTPSPIPLQPLTPAAQSALANLASDDFATREAALAALQTALAHQAAAIISSDNPDAHASIIAALHFQEGLTRFLLDASKLPLDQRNAQLDFAFQPQTLPAIALAFSTDSAERALGVKGLAKIDNPPSTALLARLLADPDRRVYVAAMDALWDRTPTDATIDALWDRAVDSGLATIAVNMGQQIAAPAPVVTFHGQPLDPPTYPDNSATIRSQDNATACELLIHLKSPHIQDKITAFLKTFDLSTEQQQANAYLWLYGMSTPAMINAFEIIENNKSPEILAALYKVAVDPAKVSSQGQRGNEQYFMTNRTSLLATFITLTGQKPEDYHLKRLTARRGMWITSTQEDEEKAVKEITAWWAANRDKVSLKPPATQPQTVPATQPALMPIPTLPGPAKNQP